MRKRFIIIGGVILVLWGTLFIDGVADFWGGSRLAEAQLFSGSDRAIGGCKDTINQVNEVLSLHVGLHVADSISYYTSALVITDPNAAASAQIQWFRDSVLLRTLRLWPGGSVYDDILCDSIVVTKDLAADTTQIAGQW